MEVDSNGWENEANNGLRKGTHFDQVVTKSYKVIGISVQSVMYMCRSYKIYLTDSWPYTNQACIHEQRRIREKERLAECKGGITTLL